MPKIPQTHPENPSLSKIKTQLIAAYKEMADFTRGPCINGTCNVFVEKRKNHCCDSFHCALALENAKQTWNVQPKQVRQTGLLFLGPQGCILEPHLRPPCALHHCRINALGTSGNSDFDKKYFAIRERIKALGDEWVAVLNTENEK